MSSSWLPTVRVPDLYLFTQATDRRTRDAALASLTKFLGAKRTFEDMELLKLWKGLFYCFWMSDRTATQQALATDLASLVKVVFRDNLIPFLAAFWRTMCREWSGIDVLRLDKFYTLLRRYVEYSFRRLKADEWSDVELYTQMLSDIPLHQTNQKCPNGIRYHLADIYLDELAKVVPEEDAGLPIKDLLHPFVALREGCPTKQVRERVLKEVLESDKLSRWGISHKDVQGKGFADSPSSLNEGDVEEDEDEDEFSGFD